MRELSREEQDNLDNVWEFLSHFKNNKLTLGAQRLKLIKTIQTKYTPEQFMQYEQIADKLLWNLRDRLHEGRDNNVHCTPYDNDCFREILSMVKQQCNYFRSGINKSIIVDKNRSLILHKNPICSGPCFPKDDFDVITMNLLFNKELYQAVIKDPTIMDRIAIPEYYKLVDYGFPNLSTLNYSITSDKLERIKRMYYGPDDREWFRLYQ